ncbi:hypothetical protein VN97_g4269 [Penicillium thymicola]|uniref:Uncharacterized protein n=1 Tax=Penicillium thymicola TaxID=293382 RepID=A0AAI9TKK2_PENTH|nr:hypothetical protein VN97_g4269 [Penicillium thymicola]
MAAALFTSTTLALLTTLEQLDDIYLTFNFTSPCYNLLAHSGQESNSQPKLLLLQTHPRLGLEQSSPICLIPNQKYHEDPGLPVPSTYYIY